jgi:GGDEF domain-containing protein
MDDIYTFYSLSHSGDNTYRRPMGRLLVQNNVVTVLEDHGITELIPAGPMSDFIRRRLARLFYNQSFEIVRASDNQIDMSKVQSIDLEHPTPHAPPPALPPVFDFYLQGMNKPHLVEFKEGKGFLDGQELAPDELEHMLTKVKMGEATISYKKNYINPDLVKSMEAQLKESVEQSKPSYDKKTLEEDSMLPGIANRYAYDAWIKQPHQGAFIMMDINDLSKINRDIEPESGNNTVKAVGEAMKEAFDKVKNENSFAARIAGDRFVAFFDNPKDAMTFAYDLGGKIDEVLPVNGTHKVSLGFGFGLSQEQAQEALNRAKHRKYAIILNNPDGSIDKNASVCAYSDGVPNLSHSFLPGASNPAPKPLDDEMFVDKMFDDESWPDNDSPPWSDEETEKE